MELMGLYSGLMKRIYLIMLLSFSLSGCAELSAYRKNNELKSQSYLTNPKEDVMVFIDNIKNDALNLPTSIQCHRSISTLMDNGSNANSFETLTPYVEVISMTQELDKLREKYLSLSQQDKDKFLLSSQLFSPTIIITCQCKDAFGLKGKIYFAGKEVSTDNADMQYGIVSLQYTLPLRKLLDKNNPS